MVIYYIKNFLSDFSPARRSDDEWYEDDMTLCKIEFTYGSVCAGWEKWPFNVLFFLKVEPPCDQT